MSATVPCTPCCTTPQSVNIPGPEGIQGSNGTNGINAFTLTTAPFNTPAINATVSVLVGSTAWMVVGMIVIVGQGVGGALANPGPQTYKVAGIAGLNQVTLQYLGYPTDSGASISAGAVVTAAGVESLAFPTTTKGDLIVDDGANSPNPHPVRLPDGVTGQQLVADPSNKLGGSVGTKWMGGDVTLYINNTDTATTGTTEETLMTFDVPAGALAVNGDTLEFEAELTCAGNAHTKRVQLYWGGVSFVDSSALAQNGGHMRIVGFISRRGGVSELTHWKLETINGAATTAFTMDMGTLAVDTTVLQTFKLTGITAGGAGDLTADFLRISLRTV